MTWLESSNKLSLSHILQKQQGNWIYPPNITHSSFKSSPWLITCNYLLSADWKHTRDCTRGRRSTVNRRDAQSTLPHSVTWGSTFALIQGRNHSGEFSDATHHCGLCFTRGGKTAALDIKQGHYLVMFGWGCLFLDMRSSLHINKCSLKEWGKMHIEEIISFICSD